MAVPLLNKYKHLSLNNISKTGVKGGRWRSRSPEHFLVLHIDMQDYLPIYLPMQSILALPSYQAYFSILDCVFCSCFPFLDLGLPLFAPWT